MIPKAIADLLQTGVSVIVGTRDRDLMPECTRAWGIQIGPDRATATIFLSESIAGKTLENLRENRLIAVSCTRPTDHIACQLKGRVRDMRPLTVGDHETSRRWHRDFMGELRAIGVPPELTEAWIAEPSLAIDIDVTDVFEQTPGPGTGNKITP
jgi:hypothetical protein